MTDDVLARARRLVEMTSIDSWTQALDEEFCTLLCDQSSMVTSIGEFARGLLAAHATIAERDARIAELEAEIKRRPLGVAERYGVLQA